MTSVRTLLFSFVVIAWSAAPEALARRPMQHPSTTRPSADSVTIRIVNTELRAAVQLLAQYLSKPVLFTGQGNAPVTLESSHPVPRDDVLRMLRGILDSQGLELVDDTASALYRVRARERATAAPPLPTATVSRALGPPELFVLPLSHARATDVAQTVSALYGRGPPHADSSSQTQTLDEHLGVNALSVAAGPPREMTGGVARRAAVLSGEIAIVPDARANSLLVRANRADFELVEAVVRQLDVRPLQALVEVLIAEVRRERVLSLGGEGSLTAKQKSNGRMTSASIADALGLGGFVLNVMRSGATDVDAALRLGAERGDVRILSRPVVLTANNERAEIVVGSQRPFIQISRALPTDAVVRDQIVQYRDVGTKLAVRPTISGDGSVQLDVTQEVSSATSETQFNAPVIATRAVRTQLLVHDGQTVVLGGLTDHQKEVVQGGIPFLSAIPLIGGLFGHATRRAAETELFVFLTPRVIRSDDDAERLSSPLRERAGPPLLKP